MHPNPVLVVLLSDVPRGVCTLEGFGEVVNFRPETRCRCGGRRSAVDPCMAGKIHWCCTVKETTQIQQESLSLQSVFNAKMQEWFFAHLPFCYSSATNELDKTVHKQEHNEQLMEMKHKAF